MHLERSPRATSEILNATAKTERSRGKEKTHPGHFTLNRMAIFFFNQKITSVAEDIGKLAPLCAVGRKVKWHSQYGKRSGSSSEIKHKITK